MCEFEWQYADNITILTWSWGVITLYSFLKPVLNWFAHACSPNQGLESPLQHRYMLTYLKYWHKGLQNDQNGATDPPSQKVLGSALTQRDQSTKKTIFMVLIHSPGVWVSGNWHNWHYI